MFILKLHVSIFEMVKHAALFEPMVEILFVHNCDSSYSYALSRMAYSTLLFIILAKSFSQNF